METEGVIYRRITLTILIDVLKQYFRMLIRNWWVLLLIGLIGSVAGVLVSSFQKPKFEARLSFALEEGQSTGIGSALNIAAMFGIDLNSSGSIFSGDNILAIMPSREIIERVLLSSDSLPDGRVETFADEWMRLNKINKGNARLSNIVFPVAKPRDTFSYLQDSVLFVLQSSIANDYLNVVRPDKKLNIYEVYFVAPDERLAKAFVETLVEQTIAYYTDLKSKRSLQTLQILEERVAFLKGETFSSIDKQLEVKDINVNPAFARANSPVAKEQMDITAYGAAYAELFKNLEIARMQYLKDIPLLQVIDKPHYPMRNLKKGRLRTGILYGFLAGIFGIGLLCFRYYIKRVEKITSPQALS